MVERSLREKRIREMTSIYYSRSEIQEAIFDFSKNREISARYFESFGKRPDSLQYKGDVFQAAKRGATSFHCSEELWDNPLEISTNMKEEELNSMRVGWDLVIDIDSKYLDFSKVMAQQIVKILKFHGVKNIGIKFSGSKGFHILVPWKSFPKSIGEVKTSDMFPEWPRIILRYLTENKDIKKMILREITKITTDKEFLNDEEAVKQVVPDIILVSPRHLFRMPYSLHEKTALASAVIYEDEIENFQPKDANPLRVEVRKFLPDSEEGEATELLTQALDWYKENFNESVTEKRDSEFKPLKIENLSEKYFPPSIQKILRGIDDGRKRALFILLNLFRAIGMERDELEKRIYLWNSKNNVPLKEGYIKSQITWSYRNKIVPPPNFDKDHYKGIGIVPTDEEIRFKNPVNYIARKSLKKEEKSKGKKSSKR